MPNELLLQMATRLLLRGRNGFARFVSWVSLIGLTLGVMILTLVTTVMNGFEQELSQRLLGSVPHVVVDEGALSTAQLDLLLEREDPSLSLGQHSPFFQGLGAITQRGSAQPVTLVGVSMAGSSQLGRLQDAVVQGSFAELGVVSQGVILGEPLARLFRLEVGDALTVAVTVPSKDSIALRTVRLNLVGTFELGAAPDYSLLVLNLADRSADQWRALGRLGTRLQLTDPMMVEQVAAQVRQMAPKAKIATWQDTYGELFQAVRLEKSMMFVLLLMVVAIASFNIVAGQSMMVNDKRAEIAILRTMGADQHFILQLFLFQGALICLLGISLGLTLGLLLSWHIDWVVDALSIVTGKHLLEGSYFVRVPTRVVPSDLVLISCLSLGLALLSAWLPARRAAEVPPAQFLH